MVEQQVSFQVEYKGLPANVTEHSIRERRVFFIQFSDARKPLTILVAKRGDGSKFWTSMPEGRQTEAEQIGRLVALYFKNNK